MKKLWFVLGLSVFVSGKICGHVPVDVETYLTCEQKKANCKEKRVIRVYSCGTCDELRHKASEAITSENIRALVVSPLVDFIHAIKGPATALTTTALQTRLIQAKNFLINELISDTTEKSSLQSQLGQKGYKQPDQTFQNACFQSYEVLKLKKASLIPSSTTHKAFVEGIFTELDRAKVETEKKVNATPASAPVRSSIVNDTSFEAYERNALANDRDPRDKK